MSAQPEVFEGSCFCRKVIYRARGPLGTMDNCHCTDCRKSHAAAFATYIEIPRAALEFVSGQEEMTTYAAPSGTRRSFCRACGSNILCWVEGDPTVEIAAGSLDTPITARPRSHIFVRSKVSWFDIQDGMPQYQGYRRDG